MTGLDAVREKLEEITRGEGRWSNDHLTHASNTIEDMKDLATEALALLESEQGEPVAWASFYEGKVMKRDTTGGPAVWWNEASAESFSPSRTAVPLYTFAILGTESGKCPDCLYDHDSEEPYRRCEVHGGYSDGINYDD